MTTQERRRLKWAVNGASLLWIAVIGWLMVATLPDDAIQNHASSRVKDRMDECAGTFSERYDCKERIIIQSGQETFYLTALRFLAVIVPPFAVTIWLSGYLRRRPLTDQPYLPNDGDWKTRAQYHTEIQDPAQAAHTLHLDDDELAHMDNPAHHLIDEIAPLDDWKERAMRNTHGHKDQE